MWQTLTKEIDGNRFHVRQLGAKQGRATLVRLTRILGPAIAELMSADENEIGPVETVVSERLARALRDFSQRVSTDDLEHFCELFGKVSEVEKDGKRVALTEQIQESFFAGKYALMMQWLLFCIEANYSDFLAGASLGKSGASSLVAALGLNSPTG